MTVRKIKSIGDVPYPIDTHSDALSPLLTAGAALGITGDSGDSAAWLQRESTSDGPTTVKSIHGRTLRWNQLIDLEARTITSQGVSMVAADGKVTLTGTATAAGSFRLNKTSRPISVTAGHKFLALGAHRSTGIYISIDGIGTMYSDTIYTATVAGATRLAYAMVPNGATVDLSFYPQLFDLTAMFGAGSEPSTVAEFEALYPLPYYPYDAGSLLPVNMEGIATEDANGDPLQTRSIPAGTLRGAGSVYDELTETERITRVGEVDLGQFTWSKAQNDSSEHYRFYTGTETGIEHAASNASPANVTCAAYDTVAAGVIGNNTVGVAVNTDGRILMYDPAFDAMTADEFKAAITGTMLHYALATPTTVEIDPPLNLTYRTAAGGTERVMVPTGEQSAPPTIVTAQGYTAESLRDAALSAIAPVENGTASTNYAVGSYLVHGGQLCKVTTAIATGESISIGTNVTATTVMAEVIALIAQ